MKVKRENIENMIGPMIDYFKENELSFTLLVGPFDGNKCAYAHGGDKNVLTSMFLHYSRLDEDFKETLADAVLGFSKEDIENLMNVEPKCKA